MSHIVRLTLSYISLSFWLMIYGNTVLTDAAAWRTTSAPEIRMPVSADGPAVWKLIERTPALDKNSLYCNLLQCSHFAATCAIAVHDSTVLGWLSGYIPPGRNDTLFVWQVCVADEARGLGLARHLIGDVLARASSRQLQYLLCTITEDNTPSWGLFGSVARALGAQMQQAEHFTHELHFGGAHDSELAVSIGPFAHDKVAALQA